MGVGSIGLPYYRIDDRPLHTDLLLHLSGALAALIRFYPAQKSVVVGFASVVRVVISVLCELFLSTRTRHKNDTYCA